MAPRDPLLDLRPFGWPHVSTPLIYEGSSVRDTDCAYLVCDIHRIAETLTVLVGEPRCLR
jgi:hypothetical protein